MDELEQYDTAPFVETARNILGLSQTELSSALGWSGYKQVWNLEKGHRPLQLQTRLAIECLLRRKGKLETFKTAMQVDNKA